ncbi:RHS repeat-associated core domain-containing protein, partial [Immundisolibacter sp.]|uniref:RHS repeat-associated core domain-containing protein n=1 Tax=Immundisolibacter sp. TaxID=1934948 RepID=UPI003565EF0D
NVDWTTPAQALLAVNTDRGFTGHEHLDEIGLIHMNGRVYDPTLGRFLSADPYVQFPETTQGLNRYTYVNNNPLSLTDPSGYFFKSLLNPSAMPSRACLRPSRARTAGCGTIGGQLPRSASLSFLACPSPWLALHPA